MMRSRCDMNHFNGVMASISSPWSIWYDSLKGEDKGAENMAPRDNWMKWRRELMDSCGQCVGFRAKGLELPAAGEGHACKPNEACPKHCPGFQINFDEIAEELTTVERRVQANANTITNEDETVKDEMLADSQISCGMCGRSENDGFLIPCRHKGNNQWVCTKCLPGLIHG